MQSEIVQAHWDISKLLEIDVDEGFVTLLSPIEAHEMVKGLLYLRERFSQAREL